MTPVVDAVRRLVLGNLSSSEVWTAIAMVDRPNRCLRASCSARLCPCQHAMTRIHATECSLRFALCPDWPGSEDSNLASTRPRWVLGS